MWNVASKIVWTAESAQELLGLGGHLGHVVGRNQNALGKHATGSSADLDALFHAEGIANRGGNLSVVAGEPTCRGADEAVEENVLGNGIHEQPKGRGRLRVVIGGGCGKPDGTCEDRLIGLVVGRGSGVACCLKWTTSRAMGPGAPTAQSVQRSASSSANAFCASAPHAFAQAMNSVTSTRRFPVSQLKIHD